MPRDPQVTGRILFSGGTGSQLASGRQTYPSGPRDLHTTRCPSGRRRTDRRIDRDLDLHNRTGSDRPALAARLAHRRRQSRSRPSSPSTSLTKGVSSPGWAAKRNSTSHACSGRWRSRSATVEHDEHTSPASSPARPLACMRCSGPRPRPVLAAARAGEPMPAHSCSTPSGFDACPSGFDAWPSTRRQYPAPRTVSITGPPSLRRR